MKLDLSSIALAVTATITPACVHHGTDATPEPSHALAVDPAPDEPLPADPLPPPPPPPPPAPESEVSLAAEMLTPCTPSGLNLQDPTPIQARAAHMLGGCGVPVEHAMPPMSSAPARPPKVAELPNAASIEEAARCPPGRQPRVDLGTTTYALVEDIHRSSDDWEVAFAVDDGQRVHVGIRLRRTCQGVAPTFSPTRTVLEVSSPSRTLVVHRCEMLVPRCGLVP